MAAAGSILGDRVARGPNAGVTVAKGPPPRPPRAFFSASPSFNLVTLAWRASELPKPPREEADINAILGGNWGMAYDEFGEEVLTLTLTLALTL